MKAVASRDAGHVEALTAARTRLASSMREVKTSGSAVVASVQPSPVYRQAPDADGYEWYYTLRLAETAGASTKLTGFSIDGYDYSAQIPAFFGSTNLPANGTLSAALRAKDLNVPANLVYSFSGVDSTGQKWTQQLTVSFMPEQAAARRITREKTGRRRVIGPPGREVRECEWECRVAKRGVGLPAGRFCGTGSV